MKTKPPVKKGVLPPRQGLKGAMAKFALVFRAWSPLWSRKAKLKIREKAHQLYLKMVGNTSAEATHFVKEQLRPLLARGDYLQAANHAEVLYRRQKKVYLDLITFFQVNRALDSIGIGYMYKDRKLRREVFRIIKDTSSRLRAFEGNPVAMTNILERTFVELDELLGRAKARLFKINLDISAMEVKKFMVKNF